MTRTQNGERVGREDEDGPGSLRARRNRIDGEDDVGELDDDERGEQRRRRALHVDLREEVMSVELGRDGHEPPEEPDRPVVAVHTFIGAMTEDLEPGVDEEQPEHEQDHQNREMSATPAAMNSARSTRAPNTPQNRTRCW